ncbi:MAG TPA: hypothetical protein VK206_17570 [Anaerolineales bacterium]|nr:hypothetical protein [Anaerolineales bacterium]
MKSTLKHLAMWIEEKQTIILAVLVILCTVTIYWIRGAGDEFSLFMEALGILVVFFCGILIPIIGIAIILASLLLYKVIRHTFDKNGSVIPLLVLVGSTILAATLPLPPIAEEASFLKYRADYEHLVTLAKANQLEHGNDCLADSASFYAFKLPEGYEHLSQDCIFVLKYSSNINVEFSPYNYAVALNYFENPGDVTKSRDCDFRGGVWKKINENWYVCKLAHTW